MAINFDTGFEILRVSDLSYEEMTVEIQYKGEQIAQINKDKGDNFLEIEFFTDFIDSNFIPKFMLNDFLTVLDEAQKLLRES
jgi:hypothetical protein